jgi:TRAP-type C4-dicarboxylate transport system permease small subunit
LRHFVEFLYEACGVLAGVFLALIAVTILIQIGARMLLIGLPGIEELAGYFLAASSFLGLAHTLRRGGHIRVNLLVRRLAPGPRRIAELGCLAVALGIAGYFSVYFVDLAVDSFQFGDRAIGSLPILLWIPQGGIAFGLIVFTLGFLDDFQRVLRGGTASYVPHEEAETLIAAEREL